MVSFPASLAGFNERGALTRDVNNILVFRHTDYELRPAPSNTIVSSRSAYVRSKKASPRE